jgi:ABC-type glutathione transport system ATPase component
MTKNDIKLALARHLPPAHPKAINAAVDEIWEAHQKALGKEARKKNTEYADPEATYHPHEKMNGKIQEFIKARKEARKPMTKRAVNQLLLKFKNGGFNIGECVEAIEVAIVGNYQGVFPKKKFRKPEHSNPDPKTVDYSEGLPTNRKPTQP